MHIILMHGLRRQAREPRMWNIACDYVINCWLKKMGFALTSDCLYNPKFEGFSAERVYNFLMKLRKQAQALVLSAGRTIVIKMPGGAGAGDEDGEGMPDKPWDQENKTGMDIMEIPDILDPAAIDKLEQQIRVKIATASAVAKMCGKSSADLDRFIKGLLNSKTPWQDILRNFLSSLKHDEENWCRPNRRVRTAYFPSKKNEVMGEIVLIGDTSGSIGDKELNQVAAEIEAIRQQVKPERIRVIWADDADCSLEEVFEEGDQLILHPKGGGGTDMRCPLKFIEQYEPCVAILVTDCLTPWPEIETPFPLIVCSSIEVSKLSTVYTPPAWAEVIYIGDE
jgi:predicted metal-dependent peptidase